MDTSSSAFFFLSRHLSSHDKFNSMYTTTVLLSWDCLCEIVHLQQSKIQKHLLLLRFIEIFQFSLLKYLLWLEEEILPWNSKMPRCKVWLNDTHEWIVITAAQILRVWLLLRYINILKEKLIYRPYSKFSITSITKLS